jgi:hypothetical protein
MNGILDQRDQRDRQGQAAEKTGRQDSKKQPSWQKLSRPGLGYCNLRNAPATPRIHRQAHLSCNQPTGPQGCQGLAGSSTQSASHPL